MPMILHTIMIYHNNHIRDLDIQTSTFDSVLLKVFAFADDVTVVCRNHQQDIQAIFSEYERLTRLSGLTLNAEKTEILNCSQGAIASSNKVKDYSLHQCYRPSQQI